MAHAEFKTGHRLTAVSRYRHYFATPRMHELASDALILFRLVSRRLVAAHYAGAIALATCARLVLRVGPPFDAFAGATFTTASRIRLDAFSHTSSGFAGLKDI